MVGVILGSSRIDEEDFSRINSDDSLGIDDDDSSETVTRLLSIGLCNVNIIFLVASPVSAGCLLVLHQRHF